MSENKVLDPMAVEASLTMIYPEEFKPMCVGREKRKIGDELGLNNFGVNLVTLKPGAASSQRPAFALRRILLHPGRRGDAYHDSGEQTLGPVVAGFPANNGDGHHLVNKTDSDVVYLEVGDRPPKDAPIIHIDMLFGRKTVHRRHCPTKETRDGRERYFTGSRFEERGVGARHARRRYGFRPAASDRPPEGYDRRRCGGANASSIS